MAEISILSPYNVTDIHKRGELYREVRNGGDESWTQYTVKPDEILMPELIAYRHYGTAELKWVVYLASSLDDVRGELESGVDISLPPKAWIRQRIIHFQGL